MGSGALKGIRVVEFAGLGPTPFAAMTLADMGAEVIRVERPGATPLIPQREDFLNRQRAWVELDLKDPEGARQALELAARADALIEGMRPGVMERLGLGPEEALSKNPRLVYGRMTGWGQEGPLSGAVGHDINYLAVTGMLHAIGPEEEPSIPINLLGDFGGGGIYLAFGIACALLEARRSGRGQVVDAAIVDGVSHLATMVHSLLSSGLWHDRRRANLLDGAAPFYRIYRCSDGKFVAVGAIEPRFWAALLEGLELSGMPDQLSVEDWPGMARRIAEAFAARTRDEWAQRLEGTEACVSPVLSIAEAYEHRHVKGRGIFAGEPGARQPNPAPRLSETPGALDTDARPGLRTQEEVLEEWSAPR